MESNCHDVSVLVQSKLLSNSTAAEPLHSVRKNGRIAQDGRR